MHFQRNFEFSERSAKMKRGTSFSDMFVCCTVFCASTLVCDCIFLLSCYIVLLSCLLSCLLSFVVLPVSFHSDFTFLAVLCLIRAAFSHPPVWLQFVMSCFALVDFGCLFALLFCSVSFELVSVNPSSFTPLCSTSLPGGNQVDGLPPALHLSR